MCSGTGARDGDWQRRNGATWRCAAARRIDPRVAAIGSEISPDAIRFERDSVLVVAPDRTG
jgi:hypothetical protein